MRDIGILLSVDEKRGKQKNLALHALRNNVSFRFNRIRITLS